MKIKTRTRRGFKNSKGKALGVMSKKLKSKTVKRIILRILQDDAIKKLLNVNLFTKLKKLNMEILKFKSYITNKHWL